DRDSAALADVVDRLTAALAAGTPVTDALDAAANFGITIFTPEFVGSAAGILDIYSQDLKGGSIQPFPPTG
ncbi:hypothetical protein WFJ45_23600, partial [Salmonella enterica subsp. enterica serovar Minnesota]|uniref:hypothetical protein n=1 Tax=Salmonella enterica TaxID=28901 RepID=UPI003D279A2A